MNPCACRDCMEITAGAPGSLCWECVDADCLAYSPEDEAEGVPSYTYDCQRTPEEVVPHPPVWPHFIDNPQER